MDMAVLIYKMIVGKLHNRVIKFFKIILLWYWKSLFMRTLSEWFCNDNIPHELHRKGDIECYDKFMQQRPNYPKIWWSNLFLI
jgi:hypothetical protein